MKLATIARLNAVLAAQAPIDGVSVPTFGVSATIRVDYQPSATQLQKDNALATLTAFDWSDAATQAYYDALDPNRQNLIGAATQAVIDNDTYLAIVAPTNAQVRDQVQALTQQTNKIIRRLAEM